MSHPSSATTQSDPRVAGDFRADIGRIIKYAPAELIGREEEFKLLNAAWSGDPSPLTIHGSPFAFRSRPHVVTFVALGGEGKTSLIAKWAVDEMLAKDWPGCDAAFAWSFYSRGTREQVAASSDLFLKEALTFFALDEEDREFAASSSGARVIAWLRREKDRCYTSAIVIAQLAFWVRSKKGRQRVDLQAWLTRLIDAMEGRIHGFNTGVAHVWAEQEHVLEKAGQRMPVEDSYIAATARKHGLTIATGNDKDFRRPGLKVFNPFKELPPSE